MSIRGRKIAILAVGVVSAAVACGFPSVEFAPDGFDGAETGVTGDERPLDEAGGADGGADAALPPDVDPSGKDKDASSYDGASKVDASGCTSCDCDGDKFLSREAPCTGGPGTVYDCDDSDPGINPNIEYIATSSWPSKTTTKTYDWNCDGEVTKQYAYNINCNALQLGAKCSTIQGFTTDVDCGQTGTFVTCKSGLFGVLGCAPGPTENRRQGCK